jgi:hypothetical protein
MGNSKKSVDLCLYLKQNNISNQYMKINYDSNNLSKYSILHTFQSIVLMLIILMKEFHLINILNISLILVH